MVQVIEHFLKATHSPSAVAVQHFAEKSSMTHGCLFLPGQKTHLFLEQEKLNMKSTYLGTSVHLHFTVFQIIKGTSVPDNFQSEGVK